jgi:hypothetical protein
MLLDLPVALNSQEEPVSAGVSQFWIHMAILSTLGIIKLCPTRFLFQFLVWSVPLSALLRLSKFEPG